MGANGVGKTTLLRILMGLEEPSAGTVQRARGLRIGYLPQEAQSTSEHSLWEECQTAFAGLLEKQAELARLEHQMADPDQAEAALAAYGKLQDAFERQGGYTYETRIRQTLAGLGFAPADYDRPALPAFGRAAHPRPAGPAAAHRARPAPAGRADQPPGYRRGRVAGRLPARVGGRGADRLARPLFPGPGGRGDLGDDPRRSRSTTATTAPTWPSATERYQRRIDEYQTQAAFIEKEEEYIRRNIAGQNTRQAQGRRKRLERLLEEARLTPTGRAARPAPAPRAGCRSGDLVLRTNGLGVGYADEGRPLFRVPDLTLRRGECAAIIGPNGAGKTTFLKTLLEHVPPY